MNNMDFIRQKCIEANPEIREEYGRCMSCGYGFDYCTKLKNCPLTYNDRPIRLADVLLAVAETKRDYAIEMSLALQRTMKGQLFIKWSSEADSCYWNLRKDDLNEQSEKTVEFIAKLLKVNNES